MADRPIAAGKSSFGLIDARKLFAELMLADCEVFLDMACGLGAYSLEAGRRVSSTGCVHAVDLWAEGIDQLRETAAVEGLTNINAEVADVRCISLDEESVDVCLMATVLHDLIEDGTDLGAMMELKRVLKRNGVLAVVEFKKAAPPPGPPTHLRLSPDGLESYLKEHGFSRRKIVELGDVTYLGIFARCAPELARNRLVSGAPVC